MQSLGDNLETREPLDYLDALEPLDILEPLENNESIF